MTVLELAKENKHQLRSEAKEMELDRSRVMALGWTRKRGRTTSQI